jgi:Glycosyl hydrolases family 18
LAALVHCGSTASTPSVCVEASCAAEGPDGSVPGSDDASTVSDGGHVADATSRDGSTPPSGDGAVPPPITGPLPRLVAYVNVTCGFGVGTNGGECLASPDPTVNYVKQWEDDGSSPITHYVLSFLSFQGPSLQTDPGEIWKSGGGSTSDFTLVDGVREALVSAQGKGKKVMLSIGGEAGSTGFLAWWSGLGSTTAARVTAMTAEIQRVAGAFQTANGVNVDGFDVDIELGGIYTAGSDKYDSTRDLINAVPETFLVAFVPQIGNGLCAAPNIGDPLPPSTTLGGQCPQPVNGDDSPWVLAGLDTDCKKSDGTPKLDYWGIQYYNAGAAACCGGGADTPSMIQSTVQSYVDLANGWPASGDLSDAANPWHSSEYFPGPWPAFAGIGADRLVLGKPGCQGCAGSDYVGLSDMQTLVSDLDGKLVTGAGGILFWDLGRLFGGSTSNCVSGTCQPSWGGSASVEQNLTTLRAQVAGLATK